MRKNKEILNSAFLRFNSKWCCIQINHDEGTVAHESHPDIFSCRCGSCCSRCRDSFRDFGGGSGGGRMNFAGTVADAMVWVVLGRF